MVLPRISEIIDYEISKAVTKGALLWEDTFLSPAI